MAHRPRVRELPCRRDLGARTRPPRGNGSHRRDHLRRGITAGETKMVLDWLRLPVELPPRDRAFADTRLAFNCTVVGDIATALPVAEVAVELGLEHGLDDVVFTMQTLAVALWFTGDLARRDQLLADGRRIACESCGANVRAAAGMFQLVALYTYHPVEALELADASLADSANFGYRHILEAYRAWLLMQLGRLDEAREAVERFSPVPPSSQWEQMNLIIAHAVIAHTGDIDTATKSYATAARELAARRPQITGDLLVGFGYLAYAHGDETRARELALGIHAFGTGPVSTALYEELEGRGDHADALAAYLVEHPVEDAVAYTAEHGPRLLAEELDRWS